MQGELQGIVVARKEMTLDVGELNAGVHLVEVVTGSGVRFAEQLIIGAK